LDPYRDIAALYDLDHEDFDDDIQFYRNVVRAGPVLEVGAGTGRITLPLVEAGLDVWAVDSSRAMLARAAGRLAAHPNAHLIEARIGDLDLEVRFGTAILALNFLWHLTDLEGRLQGLDAVRHHLREGGTLIVDLSNPHAMADRGGSGEVRQRFARPRGRGEVRGFSAAWDDEGEQLLTLHLVYDDTTEDGAVRRVAAQLELRYIYCVELELLLRLAGFRVRQLYGSYDLEPYSSGSPNLIAVADRG
jgi:SAM-dependent methyltransferase